MVTVRNDIESYVMTNSNTGGAKVKDVNLKQEVTKQNRKRSYRCVAFVASAVVALLLVGIGSILLFEHLLGGIPDTVNDASPTPKDITTTTTTTTTKTEAAPTETVRPETVPPVFVNPYETTTTDERDLIDIDEDVEDDAGEDDSVPAVTVVNVDKDGRDDDDDDDDDHTDISSGSGSGDGSYY